MAEQLEVHLGQCSTKQGDSLIYQGLETQMNNVEEFWLDLRPFGHLGFQCIKFKLDKALLLFSLK